MKFRVTLSDPPAGDDSPDEMRFGPYDRVSIADGRLLGHRSERDGSELICRIEQRWKRETYELFERGKFLAFTHISIEVDD